MFSQEGSSLTLYIREEVDLIGILIEASQKWIAVGDTITGVYISPSLNIGPLKEAITDILVTDNVIGDFNCTQRYKRQALLEKMTARNLTEVPIKGNTWRRWHQPQLKWVKSKPDVIFSIGNWTTRSQEWTVSDHAIITGTIPSYIKLRKLLITDWEFWSNFAEDEEKDSTYTNPIGFLKNIVKDNLKAKKYSPKPWWNTEIKEQRKIARRAGRMHGEWRREVAKLRNMIK